MTEKLDEASLFISVLFIIIIIIIIPREARPKASLSGVYNFVPQRAQAG